MDNLQRVEIKFQRKNLIAVVKPGGGLVDIQQKANEWSTTSVRAQYKIEDQHRILQLAYKKIPKAILQRTPAPPGISEAPTLQEIEQVLAQHLAADPFTKVMRMIREHVAAVRRAAGGF